MDWNWVWLALGIAAAGFSSAGLGKIVVAQTLFVCAFLALTPLWRGSALRMMWIAACLLAGVGVALWERQRRRLQRARVQLLRSQEREGRAVELLLGLTLSFGKPPAGNDSTDLWPVTSGWIDATRESVRSIGGDRYVDIFNTTAGLPVDPPENPTGLVEEERMLRMVVRHLHHLRVLIHEVEGSKSR